MPDFEKHGDERLAREQAASATVKRTIWWIVGVVGGLGLLAAITATVIIVVVVTGGDEDRPGPTQSAGLARVAQASGCTYGAFADEGNAHVQQTLTAADFATNPPTSGDHNVEPALDGIYAPGDEPEIENWVHTLEHGRVILQYEPDAPRATVDGLARLFDEPVAGGDPAYHTVLMRNNSKMPFAIAAVAWRQYMACPAYTPKAIDALAKFRDARVDKAPEFVP